MKKLFLLLILQLTVFSIYGQTQKLTIHLNNFNTSDYPINSITFNTNGFYYRMDNTDSISFEVDSLPTMVRLCILKKNHFDIQRIIWMDTANIELNGTIESPDGILISPTSNQQKIVDELTPIMSKNKEIDSELAFTKPYLIHLANNAQWYDNSYLKDIVNNVSPDLKDFWAVVNLKQYLTDYENIGFNPKNNQLLYLTVVNKDNKREKIEFQGEKYTLLEFTSSGCRACLEGIDKMVDFNKKYNESVEIVMIWQDKNYNFWINVAKKQKAKITWKSYLDENKAIFKSMNIKGWPTYMLIDKDGMIVKGLKRATLADIEEYLESN